MERLFDRLNSKDIELAPLNHKPLSFREFKNEYPLHYYAKIGDVEKLELLLCKDNELFKKDKLKRTPLHWAALCDNLENGVICVKKMLEFMESKRIEKEETNNFYAEEIIENGETNSLSVPIENEMNIENFINLQDFQGESCLHLAAKNENAEIVEELLMKSANVNLRSSKGEVCLALIYLNTPAAVLHLLDKGISFVQDDDTFDSTERKYKIDFEPIMGQSDPHTKKLSNKSNKVKKKKKVLQKETELLNYVKDKRESTCKEILTHSLVRMFLFLKWKKIRPFFYLSVVFHSGWLFLYGWFIIEVYYHSCQKETFAQRNFSCWQYPFTSYGEEGDVAYKDIWTYINSKDTTFRPLILLINSAFFCLKELFQLSALGKSYIKLENIMQWSFVFSLFLTLIPSESFFYYQYQISAFGVLFASFLLLDVVNKLTNWGIYFKVLIKVTKRFLESTPLFFVVMITFAISLHMLFPEQIPSLDAFRECLMTIFLMIMGKIDYQNYRESIDEHYPVTGLIIFIVFYVVISILLLRILMGFIVSDTQRLLQVVEINQILTRLEQMYLKESFLLTKLPRCFPDSLNINRFLEKLIVVPSQRYLIVNEKEIPLDLRKDMRSLASKNPISYSSSTDEFF